jgi:hypothetical protein
MNEREPLNIGNYCVSFIDLLGQRLEYKNEGRLPNFKSAEEKEQFIDKLRSTIGRIENLQLTSNKFLTAALEYKSPLREKLPSRVKTVFDEAREVRLKQQRWSDGLVYFVSLMEGEVKCPMSGVYTLLVTSGSLCFLGLAGKLPLRGSVDIAWAAELHERELYGAAVAKAYELESQVAQYPRIVVGPRVVEYLITNVQSPASDIYTECSRGLAKMSYSMLDVDSDGYHYVNYLGDAFHRAVTGDLHQELYEDSLKFIQQQGKKWRDERNTVLSLRYQHLLSYFLANPTSESKKENDQSNMEH